MDTTLLESTTLGSTLILIVLLAIGLFFFIKASVKDRTTSVKWVSPQGEAELLPTLEGYFRARSYRVVHLDPQRNEVTFEGMVAPSLFLAIFLSVLAGIGLLCLDLVLSVLAPGGSPGWWGLLVLAPGAGVFYWRRAGRLERVSLSIAPWTGDDRAPEDLSVPGDLSVEPLSVEPLMEPLGKSVLTVTAHRDELLALQQALSLKPQDGE